MLCYLKLKVHPWSFTFTPKFDRHEAALGRKRAEDNVNMQLLGKPCASFRGSDTYICS